MRVVLHRIVPHVPHCENSLTSFPNESRAHDFSADFQTPRQTASQPRLQGCVMMRSCLTEGSRKNMGANLKPTATQYRGTRDSHEIRKDYAAISVYLHNTSLLPRTSIGSSLERDAITSVVREGQKVGSYSRGNQNSLVQMDEGKSTDMHISTKEFTATGLPTGGRNHNIFAARPTTAVTGKAIEYELLVVKWMSVVLVLLSWPRSALRHSDC